MREERLLQKALGYTNLQERAAFLDQACAGDAALKARLVARLTQADPQGTAEYTPLPEASFAFVNQSGEAAPGITSDYVPTPAGAPRTVADRSEQSATPFPGIGSVLAGRYTLEKQIGEGGMGEVWIAQQTEPVKRKVALKLIKAGMDSKAVLQRFEAERQALALMDHPHIAKVLDGGLTPSGYPFFVMELVKGLALTRFCDEARLSLRGRLELFVPICQAVQHAHQKGIVHRDLKPSNILVTVVDGRPVPKVIDFGIAKAVSGKLTEDSLATQFGAVVGTLEYMAPEQAGMMGLDIDTRADIYSLGVILYELLTGLRPLDGNRLEKAALAEMIRIIREEEPSKPSTRLSTEKALPSLAAVRQTEPRQLMALLRGELDWVVMKCLEKDRDRRYATANALGLEIQRYLADEPVEARPPSFGYRAGKFLRRHKGPVAAATVVVLALLGGIVGTTWGLWEARAAAAREKQAAAEARKQAAFATEVNDFLRRDLLGLTGVRAQVAGRMNGTPDLKARELLDRAAHVLAAGERFREQPLVEAALEDTVGAAYLDVGEPTQAMHHLERAVTLYLAQRGPDHADTLRAQSNLALAYRDGGKPAQAEPLFARVCQWHKEHLGEEHPTTLATMNNLALGFAAVGSLDQARLLFLEVLCKYRRKYGPESPDSLTALINLAEICRALGKVEEALPLGEEAMQRCQRILGPDHPDTLVSMNNLATIYQTAGKGAQALALYETTLRRRQGKLGPNHPDTVRSLNNLAGAYWYLRQADKALPLFEEALPRLQATLGADHPHPLTCMNNLASAYSHTGKLERAVPLWEETHRLQRAKLGANHPDTLNTANNLASGYRSLGKLDKALPLMKQTYLQFRERLGAEHPDTLLSMSNYATLCWLLQRLDQSIPLLEEAYRLRKAKFGPDHPDTLMTQTNLGINYRDGKRFAEAIQMLEAAQQQKNHPNPRFLATALLDTYARAGQEAKALPLIQANLEAARKLPPRSPQLVGALSTNGGHLLRLKKYAEAEPVLRECLTLCEQLTTGTKPLIVAWQLGHTQSMLGGALLGQKHYQAAEPLLIQGYEGMLKLEPTIPLPVRFYLTDALERLVEVYEALGKPEEARKWRQELEKRRQGIKPVQAEVASSPAVPVVGPTLGPALARLPPRRCVGVGSIRRTTLPTVHAGPSATVPGSYSPPQSAGGHGHNEPCWSPR
jgi:tetratricopeptide (TPR) repeat protein